MMTPKRQMKTEPTQTTIIQAMKTWKTLGIKPEKKLIISPVSIIISSDSDSEETEEVQTNRGTNRHKPTVKRKLFDKMNDEFSTIEDDTEEPANKSPKLVLDPPTASSTPSNSAHEETDNTEDEELDSDATVIQDSPVAVNSIRILQSVTLRPERASIQNDDKNHCDKNGTVKVKSNNNLLKQRKKNLMNTVRTTRSSSTRNSGTVDIDKNDNQRHRNSKTGKSCAEDKKTVLKNFCQNYKGPRSTSSLITADSYSPRFKNSDAKSNSETAIPLNSSDTNKDCLRLSQPNDPSDTNNKIVHTTTKSKEARRTSNKNHKSRKKADSKRDLSPIKRSDETNRSPKSSSTRTAKTLSPDISPHKEVHPMSYINVVSKKDQRSIGSMPGKNGEQTSGQSTKSRETSPTSVVNRTGDSTQPNKDCRLEKTTGSIFSPLKTRTSGHSSVHPTPEKSSSSDKINSTVSSTKKTSNANEGTNRRETTSTISEDLGICKTAKKVAHSSSPTKTRNDKADTTLKATTDKRSSTKSRETNLTSNKNGRITKDGSTHLDNPDKANVSPSKTVAKSPIFSTPKKSTGSVKSNSTPSPSSSGRSYLSPKKSGSPKKEHRNVIPRYLTLVSELFLTVFTSRYLKNLLTDEKEYAKIFTKACPNQNLQFVCLKLFTYRHIWYNVFKFCEKLHLEIDDKEVMELYRSLVDRNVVDTDYTSEDMSSLLHRLEAADVEIIYKKFKLNKTMKTKSERIECILKHCRTQMTLGSSKTSKDLVAEEIKKRMGYSIRVTNDFLDAFFKTYLLATFTNRNFLDAREYFGRVMGNICYPQYTVEEYVVFYTRDEFLSYAKACKLYLDLETAMTSRNHLESFQICQQIYEELQKISMNADSENRYRDAPHLKQFTATAVYIRSLSHGLKPLITKNPQRVSEWLDFLIQQFPLSHRIGVWFYHLTWLHMRYLKPVDHEQAAMLLIEVLRDRKYCLSEAQLYDLGDRGKQLKDRTKGKIPQLHHDEIAELIPKPLHLEDFPQRTVDATAIRNDVTGQNRRYIVTNSEGEKTFTSVEDIAMRDYMEKSGFTGGRHCEGSLILVLFTLFFWDIIYNPEKAVVASFLSKLQEVPLDMYTAYFYENRKSLIDQRLKQIESEWDNSDMIKFMMNNYTNHSHESGLRCVDNYISDSEKGLLETLVDCISRKILAKIFERLVTNVAGFSSGMPDLLLWNVDRKVSKFVEVKGEGDRLSTKQKLWLRYLSSIGADIEVCHVHTMGSKRKLVKKIDKSKSG